MSACLIKKGYGQIFFFLFLWSYILISIRLFSYFCLFICLFVLSQVVTAGQFLTGAGVGDDIEQQQQSAEKNNNDEMAKKQLLKLPNRRHPQPDIIPNRCAICLESYEVGEHIVWSENEQCQHAFHQDCILDYLVRLEDTSKNPCPCCRQQFCQRVICTEVEPTKE